MIYTVGLIAIYEPRLAAGTAVKGGPKDDYGGGWVWESAAAAQAFLVEQKSASIRRVYGVLADWTTDTAPVEGKPYHRLLRDARVVKIDAGAAG
jgi:hypothetical protein